MRTIDADKLKLGIISQSNTGREDYSTELICEFIDQQPTVEEWIPCSERLPDESGTYIVSAIDGNILRVSFAKWMPRLRTWALSGGRSYWKVKAWMPFPDSYKPEGEIV